MDQFHNINDKKVWETPNFYLLDVKGTNQTTTTGSKYFPRTFEDNSYPNNFVAS
jgi:hypothetical protein